MGELKYMGISVDKWTKYKLLLEEEKLASNLPATKLFTEESLWEFLDHYGAIIIKPCFGHRGKGVIQVTSLTKDKFEIHAGMEKITIYGKDLFEYLKENHCPSRRRYIVQKKIDLAKVTDCPVDIRVIVQRKKILQIGMSRVNLQRLHGMVLLLQVQQRNLYL